MRLPPAAVLGRRYFLRPPKDSRRSGGGKDSAQPHAQMSWHEQASAANLVQLQVLSWHDRSQRVADARHSPSQRPVPDGVEVVPRARHA